MSQAIAIRPVAPLDHAPDDWREAARAEGYRFVDRLVCDWRSGANRFDGPGETFLGAFDGDRLVAFGGVNRDPYMRGDIGRLRHVYVLPEWRRSGVGRRLVAALTAHAAPRFSRLRLRATDERAARFYERMGFQVVAEPDATHAMDAPRPTARRRETCRPL